MEYMIEMITDNSSSNSGSNTNQLDSYVILGKIHDLFEHHFSHLWKLSNDSYFLDFLLVMWMFFLNKQMIIDKWMSR